MSERHVYGSDGRRWEAVSLVGGIGVGMFATLVLTGQTLSRDHRAAATVPAPAAGHPVRRPAHRPGPYTAAILRLLRRHHARATFFVVGDRIRDWRDLPAAEARVVAVGDHMLSHAYLPRLGAREAAAEVTRGRAAAERATGAEVLLFRPPYDARSAAVERRLRARGMLEVLWSLDASDYRRGRLVGRIARDVARRLRPGSIVLLHDIQPRSVAVVDRLLPLLERRRLRPVGIPELVRVNAPSWRLLRAGGAGCWR